MITAVSPDASLVPTAELSRDPDKAVRTFLFSGHSNKIIHGSALQSSCKVHGDCNALPCIVVEL